MPNQSPKKKTNKNIILLIGISVFCALLLKRDATKQQA